MKITQRPPTPFALPGGGLVHIATQRWELDRWAGAADPPDLARTWAIKPKFSVNGGPEISEVPERGLVGPLDLPRGERAVINVVLEDSLRCALGVSAYAN